MVSIRKLPDEYTKMNTQECTIYNKKKCIIDRDSVCDNLLYHGVRRFDSDFDWKLSKFAFNQYFVKYLLGLC